MTANEMDWPQSCMNYDGSYNSMGHTWHKCKHPASHGKCMPCTCPLKKLGELNDELDKLMNESYTCSKDEKQWYADEIKWLESEIEKLM